MKAIVTKAVWSIPLIAFAWFAFLTLVEMFRPSGILYYVPLNLSERFVRMLGFLCLYGIAVYAAYLGNARKLLLVGKIALITQIGFLLLSVLLASYFFLTSVADSPRFVITNLLWLIVLGILWRILRERDQRMKSNS